MATKTPRLLGTKLKKYFREHVAVKRIRHQFTRWDGSIVRYEEPGFYTVTKPLQVFKQTYTPAGTRCITNLTIPVGAIIYASKEVFNINHKDDECRVHERKMRASLAVVHSNVTNRNLNAVQVAVSEWDNKFKYIPGKTVKPRHEFDMDDDQCKSGIHFFLNLQDAVDYN
jgi:beta-lactamase class D